MQHSANTEEVLIGWRNWRDWRKAFAAHLFQSDASFEWFVRRHRDELIKSEQYIPRKGRGGAVVGPEIGTVVLGIMRRDAAGGDEAA